MANVCRTLLIIVLVNLVHGAAGYEIQNKSKDVPDARRLTKVAKYRTKKGDTLRDIAHFLYGRQEWWTKIQKENRSILRYGSRQQLPEGLSIRYHAAEVGSHYTVQPGDWLIRIAQWKYGDSENWEKIYKKNEKLLSNPNLIHPGDQLSFEVDGTVRRANSGEVVVRGVRVQEPVLSPAQPPVVLPVPEDPLSAPGGFVTGFFLGILLLLATPLIWWSYRRRPISRPASKKLDFLPLEDAPRNDIKKVRTSKKVSRRNKEFHPEKKPFKSIQRKSTEEAKMDESLIHRDQGEIDRRPNYHSISRSVSGLTTRKGIKNDLKIKDKS